MESAAFTIYKSSAGSGKTYTLVRDFLLLVLKNPAELKHTLAVTFTNKATAEMKSRIINAVHEISSGYNSALKEEIEKKLPGIDIKQNAKVVLNAILHGYSSFSINTIDSFFVKIVKSLSRELGLPGKYDVEVNRDAAVDFIISELLNLAGEDKDLTPFLEEFIFSKLDDDKGWRIEKELYNIASEIFSERYSRIPHKKITQENIRMLKGIRFGFENKMIGYGELFKSVFEKNNLDISDFHYGKSGFVMYLLRLRTRQNPADYKLKSRFTEAALDRYKRFSKTASGITVDIASDIDKILTGIYSLIKNEYKKYLTATEILSLIYVAGLTSYLETLLKKYRDENSLFLLSDTGKILSNVISLNDTPFIYEKIGNRFRHFLIDEFQDTSFLQWKNMQPLAENSLSQGNRLLTVGDVKQSIYRWRGGDLTLLLSQLETDLAPFKTTETIQNLSTNYRSLKKIVEFNNLFFSSLKQWALGNSEFNFKMIQQAFEEKNITQQVARNTPNQGYVSFSLLKEEESEDKIINPDIVRGWKKSALLKLSETIRKSIGSGYKPSDICVLVRSNNDGTVISEYLSANGFPKIISPDSLLLNKSAQVNFIINCFRLIDNPQNQPAHSAVSFYYTACICPQSINQDTIFQHRANDKKLDHFFSHLLSYANYNIYELAEKLVAEFFSNNATNVFILRLLDLVKEFADKSDSGLGDFLSWWDNDSQAQKISVILPPDEDSIRVSTIHKSKGLQYPVVIIPFFDWEMYPRPSSTIWAQSAEEPFNTLGYIPLYARSALSETYFAADYETECELTVLENINTIYVAFTRAEEKLYVFCPEKPRTSKNASSILKAVLNQDDMKAFLNIANNNYLSGTEFSKTITSAAKKEGWDYPSPVLINSITQKFNPDKTGFKIKKYDSAEQEELIETGIDVHFYLSKYLSADDEKKILEQLEKRNTSAEILIYIKTGIGILKEKKWIAPYFKISTECEIASKDNELLRIDRLLINEKNAIVIDFKTGSRQAHYEQQLNKYAETLLQIGYQKVEKYLVMLSENKAVEIT